MYRVKIAAAIAAFAMAASSAMAAIPMSTSVVAHPAAKTSALMLGAKMAELKDQKSSGHIQLASFADGCNDPNYRWWQYSGWEAIACLGSGQW